jgi:hypothetical protein
VRKRIDHRANSQRRHFAKTVSPAWASFSKRLAFVLGKLEEDQCLIVEAMSGNRFVQFACLGKGGMRAEVTSNHCLDGKDRLNRRQISWLRAHGWNAPTHKIDAADSDKDQSGSPNYFVDFPASVPTGDIARLAVEALVYGLEISRSTSLIYKAFEIKGGDLRFEELGLKTANPEGSQLMEKVLEVFRRVTGITDLEFDKDGDISISRAGVPIWATQVESRVRMFAMLAHDMAETPAILRRLNELNKGSHGFRCALNQGTIYASLDIMANPLIPTHFEVGIEEFAGTAVRLASLLKDEFSWGFFTETGATPHVIQ